MPGETGLIDTGLRECEGRWVGRFLHRLICSRIGHTDWGEAGANGICRSLYFELQSFDCVGKLPLIIDATREAITRLHCDYTASFLISLKVPPPEQTPAQKELLERFEEEQDRAAFEQRQRDHAEYLERLHLLELKKQEGAEITPEDFSPSERAPDPEPPWEKESEQDNDADAGDADDGDIATKEKPAPPTRYPDDEHPLSQNYFLMGELTLDTVWFYPRRRDLAIQLMRREPDEEYPEDKEPKA